MTCYGCWSVVDFTDVVSWFCFSCALIGPNPEDEVSMDTHTHTDTHTRTHTHTHTHLYTC